MKNKNYYPFDRNHYFYGKLLTVRDFEVEQRYNNNKRRLLNKLLQGTGVVAGLDVVQVDDQSISIESGMALDDYGREIVVQEPVLKRLRLIDGFEQVKDSSNIYLCMEYDETLTEPVHSIVSTPTDDSGGNQYNRITESYRFYLTDQPLAPDALLKYKLEKERKVIFQNQMLTIEQIVPRYVEQGKKLDITINISKKGTIEPVEVQYMMEAGHLKDELGNPNLEVLFQEKENKKEWGIEKKYVLSAEQVKKTLDRIRIPSASFSVKIGDETFTIDEDVLFNVQVIDRPIGVQLCEDFYSQDFSDMVSGNSQTALYLAKLHIITSGDMYIIETLEKMPFGQYVINNNLLQMMLEASATTSNQVDNNEYEFRKDTLWQELRNKEDDPKSWFATGVEDIDLGFDKTKNKRFFSHEIAHGLGNGPVAIVLAVEETKQYVENSGERVLIFGENSIFKSSQFDSDTPEYRMGALAYPDKGTFRIGLHLLEQGKQATMKVRWWAYKDAGEEQKDEGLWALKNIKISITPNTVTVAPREKVHLIANIEGTKNKECRWQVKENNGGTIDYNGVYEAPNAEGIYEIIAQSVKYPQKKASAYVVVKA
ncbi:hypothetical protein [Desulfuribacillus alkaliarsenatis]|uniref:Uncharacterized protein n=1 Tax=Desulfuribacillus alkaliarsenatis TaxID=766136 RepID=A0A1E5G2C4_9FIRM|nr:hypothetical protein [Desulfuribacillus alkaliarsenatis]OEF97121.1 hypothetical protein BHF68_05865 [Desulfuribacillus alkaliarsenatis]